MNHMHILIATLVVCAADASLAQSPQPATAQKSLASTLNVYVFPTAGQAADQQNKDEGECYQWAVSNSGVDPFEAEKQVAAAEQQAQAQQQQAQQASKGAGARGAVGGAAAGAVIGEVASDDAGEGAAIGAAVGAVSARRRARKAEEQSSQQAQAQTQQADQLTEEQVGNFKKAFSACLEAKKYMVKY